MSSEASEVKKAIDEFEQTLMIASENSLFNKQSEVRFKDIHDKLDVALGKLATAPPDIIAARAAFAEAYDLLNSAVEKAGRSWRLQYSYAVPHFLYLLGMLALLVYAWIAYVETSPVQTFVLVPYWAYWWGALGSLLQGFWWLWNQVSLRHFRRGWIAWFLSVPFIGGLMGGIIYLAFVAGFVAATKSTLQDNTVPLLLAALAGFSWRWTIRVFENLTKLFSVGGQS